MAIRVTCPSCRAIFDLSDTLRGKQVRCKECKTVFICGGPPGKEKPTEQPKQQFIEVQLVADPPVQRAPQAPANWFPAQPQAAPPPPVRRAPVAPPPTIAPPPAVPPPPVAAPSPPAYEQQRAGPPQGQVVLVVGVAVAVLLVALSVGGFAIWLALKSDTSQQEVAGGTENQPSRPENRPAPMPPRFIEPPPPAPVEPSEPTPILPREPRDPPPRRPREPRERPEEKPEPPAEPVVWKVKPDGVEEPVVLPSDQKLSRVYPDSQPVLYPSVPSFHVAVGRNFSDREIREVVNLKTKKVEGQLKGRIDGHEPFALSRDGAYFAAKTRGGGGSAIEVYSVKKGKRAQVIDVDSDVFGPEFMDFAGVDNIVTIKRNRDLGKAKIIQVWEVTTGNAVRQIVGPESYENKSEALSPGGKYLALVSRDKLEKLMVYDLAAGELAGEIVLPKPPNIGGHSCQGLAFSPDGTELAGLFSNFGKSRILCWDVADGKLKVDHRFPAELTGSGKAMEWVPDKSAWLVQGRALIDYKSGVQFWTFAAPTFGSAQEAQRRMFDRDHMVAVTVTRVKFQENTVLQSVILPKDKLEAALKEARTFEEATVLKPAKPADWSAAKTITLSTGDIAWSVEPDPAPSAKGKPLAKPITLRAKGADVHRIMFTRPDLGQAGVLTAAAPSSLSRKKSVRLDRYDLASGSHLGTTDLMVTEEDALPAVGADLSPDGSTVVLREFKDGKRLDVWSIEKGEHLAGWFPYEKEKDKDDVVSWVAMLDGKRVLTLNPAGKLVLWSVPEGQAVYSVETGAKNGQGLCLSPGRKYVAVFHDKTYYLLDAATGESKGRVVAHPGSFAGGAGAFSPDGKELAAIVTVGRGSGAISSILARWDLKTGELAAYFPAPAVATELSWRGSRHILLGNEYLFDVERKLVLCRYKTPMGHWRHAASSPDGRHWFSNSQGADPANLLAHSMPDEAANRLAALANDKNAIGLVRPGSKVSLNLNFTASTADAEGFRKRLHDRLVERLRAYNLTVEDGAPVVLHVQAQETDTGETMELKPIGPRRIGESPFAKETVPVKKLACQISLADAAGTAVLWKTDFAMTNRQFGILNLRENENSAAALSRELWDSFASWAGGVPLPSMVLRVGNGIVVLPGDAQLTGDK